MEGYIYIYIYMVVSLNYCSQNGGNLYRAPYYNGNPNIGPRIIGDLDQYPYNHIILIMQLLLKGGSTEPTPLAYPHSAAAAHFFRYTGAYIGVLQRKWKLL